MDKQVKKVIRKFRSYKPFEAKKPRLRNTCPSCGSLSVSKRKMFQNYKCRHCGWIGEKVKIIEY